MATQLTVEQILTDLSRHDEKNEQVWSAAVAALSARKEWPDEASFDRAYDEIMAAMIKGLSAAEQAVLVATSVRKAHSVVESDEQTAKREKRRVINNRLRQRIARLRERLFPNKELFPEPKPVRFLARLLMPPFSMLAIAPSKCGKTTLVRQFVQCLLSMFMQVLVLSGTAHLTRDFAFLPKESVCGFDSKRLENLIVQQTLAGEERKHVLVIVDDVLGDTAAANNKHLLQLFTTGRHIGISVIVLSQSLTRITIPAIKTNSDIIAFSNLSEANIVDLRKNSFGSLKADSQQLLDFVNDNTGTSHDYAFAVYHRMNAKVYTIRADGGRITPDITPPSEPVAAAPATPAAATPAAVKPATASPVALSEDDELAAAMGGIHISSPAATPEPDAAPAIPESQPPALFKGRRSYVAGTEPEQDLYETPKWAVEKMISIILSSTSRDLIIWEACHGNGRITDSLREAGFKVIATDFFTLPEKRDFLTWQPDEPWDILITNPPYMDKEVWMKRAHSFEKPWLFLYPLNIMATKYCHNLTTELPLQVWIEATLMKFTNEGEERAVGNGMIWIGGRWASESIIKYLPYGK